MELYTPGSLCTHISSWNDVSAMCPSSDLGSSESDLAVRHKRAPTKTIPQVFSGVLFAHVLPTSEQTGMPVKGSDSSPVRSQIVWKESHQSADLCKTPTWTPSC